MKKLGDAATPITFDLKWFAENFSLRKTDMRKMSHSNIMKPETV